MRLIVLFSGVGDRGTETGGCLGSGRILTAECTPVYGKV